MPEEELFTIGKVAKLMGIQAQLLRYYCDIGLVTPEYIDPDSGYRYFSFKQFPYIDRTRFLLKCGLSLKDIKTVQNNDDIGLLVELLNEEKKLKEEELKEIRDSIHTIEWYIDYFAYSHTSQSDAAYQIKQIKKRHLFAVKCPESYEPKDFYNLFNRVKNQERYRNLKLTRQVTVILDYDALLRKELVRFYVGKFVLEEPRMRSEHILEIPASKYYCFRADINSSSWNPDQIRIPLADKKKPSLVLANEYERSLSCYNNNPHEVQILFDKLPACMTF